LSSGYHDTFYHEMVIPAMTCASCRKNRSGVIPSEPNNQGFAHVC
jgi:hypothetical protein